MSLRIDFKQREDLKIENSLPWLAPIQTSALALFKESKLPNRKIEHWKYNDMSFLNQQSLTTAIQPTEKTQKYLIENSRKISLDSMIEIVFIDGYLVSSIDSIKGLTITPFNQANQEQQKTIKINIEPEFDAKNLLNNLNNVINHNGFLIQTDKNVVIKKPIYLRYLTSGEKESLTSHKLVVDLAESSQLTLIEHFESEKSEHELLALQQTLITLGSNSHLSHHRLNLEKDTARQVSQVKTKIGKDASIKTFYLGLGSRLNRTDIDVIHTGENGESRMMGIYLPAGEQTIDYHSNVQHRVAHCNSHEVFRGIIADEAIATFNGKIHIFQDAQKSDAYLNNKNILLTNKAQINTKPELEIYADDVKCAHGATVAKLDEKSIYYLQTRGINYKKAKKMLSIAFIQELLNTVDIEALKSFLVELLDQHMLEIK